MSWRLKVIHTTQFQYESDVSASFNEARMTPINTVEQLLIQHQFHVSPSSSIYEYLDYFGTSVKSFDVQQMHTQLAIRSESIVETFAPNPSNTYCSWQEIDSPLLREEFSEYLTFTNLVDRIFSEFELREMESPLAAVHFLNTSMRDYISYVPGSTHVYSPASEAWGHQAGVCQDFTHASISLLRSAGIPARYVSGYLYTGSGSVGDTVVGESHSWVEAWVGEWLAIDPTNGRPVSEDHIIVAKGRDYHDVSPLRGIFSGGRSRKTEVSVAITRLS